MHLSVLQRVAAAALATAIGACAGMPQPSEQIDAARAAVALAQPLAVQDGAPELHTAQAKLALAEQAMQRGDYVAARVLAEQAEVDAKYAWTLAENARLQRARNQLDGRQK